MWIDRLHEPVLRRLADAFPAVIVTGARQTGKTSLVRRTFPDHTYVSLDLQLLAEQAEEAPASFLQAHPPPVVIDEVQYAPRLFRHLKIAIDRDRGPGQFILTGSQQFGLMRNVSDSLAGRSAIMTLPGLSVSEISASGWRPDMDGVTKLLTRGSFPELWANPNVPARDFLHAYVATYLERDLRQTRNVGSLRDFERFLRICATRAGQLLNRSELARDIGVSHTTVGHWLSALQAGEQIVLLEPWFANTGQRMVKSPKLYFADTGLLCFLLGLNEDAFGASPLTGHVWENLLMNELRISLARDRRDWQLWFYRDQRNREADFLIEGPRGRIRLADAKWHETARANSFRPLQRIADAIKASPDIDRVDLALIGRMDRNAPLRDAETGLDGSATGGFEHRQHRHAVSAWHIADWLSEGR